MKDKSRPLRDLENSDYVPVDILAIDAYATLQFRNSAE